MKFKTSLAVIACLFMTSSVYAQNAEIFVDNSPLECDQPPIVENSRVLVPFRAIFEALGADVNWDSQTKTITANNNLTLTIGSDKMYIDGKEITLDVSAKIVNSRTLVPVRAVSEGLGCSVEWDAQTKTVNIYTTDDTEEIELKQGEADSDFVVGDDLLIKYAIEYPVIGNPEKDSVTTKINNTFENDAVNVEKSLKSGDFYSEIKEEYDSSPDDFVQANYFRMIKNTDTEEDFISALFETNTNKSVKTDKITSLTVSTKTGEKMSAEEILSISKDELIERIEKAFDAEIEKGNADYYKNASSVISEKAYSLPFLATKYGITVYAEPELISDKLVEVDIDIVDIEESKNAVEVEVEDNTQTSAYESSSSSSSSYDIEDTGYDERVSDSEIKEFISGTILPSFAPEVKGGAIKIGGYSFVENTHCVTVIVQKDDVTRRFAVSYDLGQAFMYDETEDYYITLGY